MSALLVLLLTSSCSSSGQYVWVSDLPRTTQTIEPLRPGDRILVSVQGQEAMSGEFEVRAEGDVVLPTAGRFQAEGQNPERLALEVAARLRGMLTEPRVTIVVASRRSPTVGILGEVRSPSRYELRQGEGVLDALARAGGLTPFADPDLIFVIRKSKNQAPLRIRFRYSRLTLGDPASVGFELRDGDVVLVE